MDKLCVYIHFDVTKLLENGALVRAYRALKAVFDELNFISIEPAVWEFQGEAKDDLAAHALMITRFKQFDIFDKFEYLLVRYADGTIEDCLKEDRKAEEKAIQRAKELGWLDENGNIMPLRRKKKVQKK